MVVAPLIPILAPIAIEAGKVVAQEVGKALEEAMDHSTTHSSNPGPQRPPPPPPPEVSSITIHRIKAKGDGGSILCVCYKVHDGDVARTAKTVLDALLEE